MAVKTYCPRGGQNGYMVTKEDLVTLSKELGTTFIDEFIPVPDRKPECRKGDHSEIGVYWETPTGSHGWACEKCGMVLQWG